MTADRGDLKVHYLHTYLHFLKYDDLVLSLSFLALAPDCKPSDASAEKRREQKQNSWSVFVSGSYR